MNICFYTYMLPNPVLGGVERVTYNLSEYFRQKGISVFNLISIGKQKFNIDHIYGKWVTLFEELTHPSANIQIKK